MNIVKLIEFFLPNKLILRYREYKVEWKKKHKCLMFPILAESETEEYPEFYRIKDISWETVSIAHRYEFSKECEMCFRFEAQSIRILKNAMVSKKSDIVITEKGVIWDKYYNPNFTKIVPKDNNLYLYDQNHVWLKKYTKSEHIQGKILSLLGVHSAHWAHFITQYLPKLYYAEEAGLLKDKLTIITSPAKDVNIKEIYTHYMECYPNISFLEVQDDTYYECEELYYMPSLSHVDDDSIYLQTCDIIIPKTVQNILAKKLVQPLVEKIKNNKVKYTKLYIVRRDTYRKINNWQEIENYFISKGFYIIEGGELRLEEKADLFYHAEYIVGAESSGWSNIMFCNHAKGLILTNISQSVNTFAGAFAKIGNVELLRVTGDDIGYPHPHVDSYIPLEKVKIAYESMINKS